MFWKSSLSTIFFFLSLYFSFFDKQKTSFSFFCSFFYVPRPFSFMLIDILLFYHSYSFSPISHVYTMTRKQATAFKFLISSSVNNCRK